MLSFIEFFKEDSSPSIHKLEGGATVYHHEIGNHSVQTHFYPRETSDNKKHYDMHFVHDGSFDRKSKTDSAHKVKAMHSVISHLKHFIEHEKPDSITSSPNTKKKEDFSHNVFSHIAKKHGSNVSSMGKDTSIHFSR